ncbi:polysaccharide pyruvyl transferase family protein [Dactylosporangium sp. CS-047395]|uniref:polysaccharide pyruvyl transferase family protein n=1 Tax=Dactylosporangium sp. CS-047395 TaxID=3239936 RepID=UPI003D8E04D3
MSLYVSRVRWDCDPILPDPALLGLDVRGHRRGSPVATGRGGVLIAGTVATGALNYGYSLLLVYLLAPAAFATVASVASLLLVVGAAAAATIPWSLAHDVTNSPAGSRVRREAIGFATVAATAMGALAAIVVCALTWRYAHGWLPAAVAVACLSIFLTAVVGGYLQGTERFAALAAFRLAEVVVRCGAGLGLTAVTSSAAGGVAGFTAGGLACVAIGGWLLRRDLPRFTVDRGRARILWTRTAGVGLVQTLIGTVQALDSILLGLTAGDTPDVGAYQTMLTLARIPLFIATALSVVSFAPLAAEHNSDRKKTITMRMTLRTYLAIATVTAAGVGTTPDALLALVLPDRYLWAAPLLPALTIAGVCAGLLALTAGFFLAAGRYRALTLMLAVAVPVNAAALAVAAPDVIAVAWTAAATMLATAATAAALLARWRRVDAPVAEFAGLLATGGALWICRDRPIWWFVVLAALCCWAGARLRLDARQAARARMPEPAELLRETVVRAGRDRRQRPGRLLLIGNYGNGNTGDESILAGLLDLLGDRRRATVISRNPAAVEALHRVAAVPTLSRAAVRALLRSDAIGIGGGGIFGDGLPPLVRLLPWAALAARAMGKEVYFLSLGAYANTPATTRRPLRLAARLATAATARDPESVRTLGGRSRRSNRVALVPDPSLFVRPAGADAVRQLLTGAGIHGPSPLVVNVKAMPDVAALNHTLAALAAGLSTWAVTHDRPIVFLALSTRGDYGLGERASDLRLAEAVIRLGGLSPRARIVGPGLEPALAKALCREAAAVIAMRLHAQIFTTGSGTPLLSLPFEPKTRLWLAEHALPGIETADLTPADVAEWLTANVPPTGERRHRHGFSAVAPQVSPG